MSSGYRLKFLPEAREEWNALDGSVKAVLRKLLKKRLERALAAQAADRIMTLGLALVATNDRHVGVL